MLSKDFYYCIDSRKCQILMLLHRNVVKTALIYSVVTLYLGLRPRIKKKYHYMKINQIWPQLQPQTRSDFICVNWSSALLIHSFENLDCRLFIQIYNILF